MMFHTETLDKGVRNIIKIRKSQLLADFNEAITSATSLLKTFPSLVPITCV